MQKDVLKNFVNFTGKHQCWSPFLIKLKAFCILFLRIFRFLKLLHRTKAETKSSVNQLLLLIFKHYLYTARENGTVCFTNLELYLIKIKTKEQNISEYSCQKKQKC